MNKVESDIKKGYGLFDGSEEELKQLSCRFNPSTLSKIKELSQASGESQAKVVRRLVEQSLEELERDQR